MKRRALLYEVFLLSLLFMQCLILSATGTKRSIPALPRSRAEACHLLEAVGMPLEGTEVRFVVTEDVQVTSEESYKVEVASIGFRKYLHGNWGLTEHVMLFDEPSSADLDPSAEDVKLWLLQATQMQAPQPLRAEWVSDAEGMSLMLQDARFGHLRVVLDVASPQKGEPDGGFRLSQFWTCHGIVHGKAWLRDIHMLHDAFAAIRGSGPDVEVV